MMREKTDNILRDNGLRATECRKSVLEMLLRSGHAISHADLEIELDDQFDRVSIYRALNAFMESGIIHKVHDDSDAAKYAICSDQCTTRSHKDDHIHFKCTTCLTIECLNDASFPEPAVPQGYLVTSSNVLLEGTCLRCSK